MRTSTSPNSTPATFAQVNRKNETKVWVPEIPTARRSVYSQVRHAVYRVIDRVSAQPARSDKDIRSLTRANARLRDAIETLQGDLKMDPEEAKKRLAASTASIRGWDKMTPREQLAVENKLLQARHHVVVEMLEADRQFFQVVDSLLKQGTDEGADMRTIQAEAHALYRTLHGLEPTHRHNARAVANAYSPRLEGYLHAMDTRKLEALEASTRAHFTGHKQVTPGDKPMMETLLFCTQAALLFKREDRVVLADLKPGALKAIMTGAKTLLSEIDRHGALMQPKNANEPIPGTRYTMQKLQDVFKNADAELDRRTVRHATKIIMNAPDPSQWKNMSPQDRQALNGALDVYKNRPDQFSPNLKRHVDAFSARVARGSSSETSSPRSSNAVAPSPKRSSVVAPLAPRPPALSVGDAKTGFQAGLRQAMNLMWKFPMDKPAYIDSATGSFVDAIGQYQYAVIHFKLSDKAQHAWIREAVVSMDRERLDGLQQLMEKDLLTHIETRIEDSGLPAEEALAFANQWAYEVELALRLPEKKTST